MSQTSPVGVGPFSYVKKLSSVPLNLHRCRSRERKHSIALDYSCVIHYSIVLIFLSCMTLNPFYKEIFFSHAGASRLRHNWDSTNLCFKLCSH